MTNLQEKGRKIRQKLANIRKFREEQDKLVAQLEIQAEMIECDIDPAQIKTMGYDYVVLADGTTIHVQPKLMRRWEKLNEH